MEGVGDHAAEYMTGGTVVVLGRYGWNVGAGMSGGDLFVYDPHGRLATRLNTQMVEADRPFADHIVELRFLVERHLELTGSPRAAELLAAWEATIANIWHVVPKDRAKAIEAQQSRVGASA